MFKSVMPIYGWNGLLTQFFGDTPAHRHVDFCQVFFETNRVPVVLRKLRRLGYYSVSHETPNNLAKR